MRNLHTGDICAKNGLTSVGSLPRGDFPQNDPKGEDVGFFGILVGGNDLWGHPLVGPDLAGHVVLEALRPPEVSELHVVVAIDQQIQALQIPMQNGLFSLVEVVNSSGCIKGKVKTIFPGDVRPTFTLQHRPEGAAGAVLQDNCKVRGFRAGSQEHHDVGVPKSIHRLAFADEILYRILILMVNFKYLDCHCCLSPRRPVNDPIAAF